MRSYAPVRRRARCSLLASAGASVSVISELLPEPLTPVMTVSVPSGMSMSTFLRLCSVTPRKLTAPLPGVRRVVGHRDLSATRQVGGRQRIRAREDGRGRADAHDLAAVLAGARPHVDHEVGRADRLLVVLDHDDRVAEVAQPLHRRDQAGVVALVQADATARRGCRARPSARRRSASPAGCAAPRRRRATRCRARASGSRARRRPGTAAARESP